MVNEQNQGGASGYIKLFASIFLLVIIALVVLHYWNRGTSSAPAPAPTPTVVSYVEKGKAFIKDVLDTSAPTPEGGPLKGKEITVQLGAETKVVVIVSADQEHIVIADEVGDTYRCNRSVVINLSTMQQGCVALVNTVKNAQIDDEYLETVLSDSSYCKRIDAYLAELRKQKDWRPSREFTCEDVKNRVLETEW